MRMTATTKAVPMSKHVIDLKPRRPQTEFYGNRRAVDGLQAKSDLREVQWPRTKMGFFSNLKHHFKGSGKDNHNGSQKTS